ncbi:uncharacterized protein TRIADDRAFT_62344 [Trichoplax adhaerens]|uniref:Uncharacterized protein n=1 Tax=Trichoplax adhaerens TaxID=10228 RepID=B3SDI6_TRIAD|nr:predicted protein [Trichoplax adhaerens]EDV19223.1 predicted protein [Trichoplax adhaerens]|eukprot:XP_002118289.1 predicted protein [Trichoplax adhaerens]
MAFNIFNLTSLSLENNYIADLKFLALMKTLISLNLKNNLISELKVEEFINLIHLENLKQLKQCCSMVKFLSGQFYNQAQLQYPHASEEIADSPFGRHENTICRKPIGMPGNIRTIRFSVSNSSKYQSDCEKLVSRCSHLSIFNKMTHEC